MQYNEILGRFKQRDRTKDEENEQKMNRKKKYKYGVHEMLFVDFYAYALIWMYRRQSSHSIFVCTVQSVVCIKHGFYNIFSPIDVPTMRIVSMKISDQIRDDQYIYISIKFESSLVHLAHHKFNGGDDD